jgi:hypothetical protein
LNTESIFAAEIQPKMSGAAPANFNAEEADNLEDVRVKIPLK